MAQLEVAGDRGQRDSVGRVEHVGLGVEDGEDLLHRRHRGLEGVVQLRELLQRVEEAGEVGDEGDEDADAQLSAAHDRAPVPEDDDRPDGAHELDEREVDAALDDGPHVHVAVLGVHAREGRAVGGLAAERLEDTHPGDRLLQVGAHRGEAVADEGVGPR